MEDVARLSFFEAQRSGMEIGQRGDELKGISAAGETGDGQANEAFGVLRTGRIGLVGLDIENFQGRGALAGLRLRRGRDDGDAAVVINGYGELLR